MVVALQAGVWGCGLLPIAMLSALVVTTCLTPTGTTPRTGTHWPEWEPERSHFGGDDPSSSSSSLRSLSLLSYGLWPSLTRWPQPEAVRNAAQCVGRADSGTLVAADLPLPKLPRP
jgi:hypothetical protein